MLVLLVRHKGLSYSLDVDDRASPTGFVVFLLARLAPHLNNIEVQRIVTFILTAREPQTRSSQRVLSALLTVAARIEPLIEVRLFAWGLTV